MKKSNPTAICAQCGTIFPCSRYRVVHAKNNFCSMKCHGEFKTGDVVKRFWENVEKTDTCWNWTGQITIHGYGHLSIKNKPVRVHRLSYKLHYGDIDPGKVVCHSCDNYLCVRPDHLWLGSQQENMDDMVSKGRSLKGEKNPSAKIKEDDVRNIRKIYNTVPTADIAAMYGLEKSVIYLIVKRKLWKSVI